MATAFRPGRPRNRIRGAFTHILHLISSNKGVTGRPPIRRVAIGPGVCPAQRKAEDSSRQVDPGSRTRRTGTVIPLKLVRATASKRPLSRRKPGCAFRRIEFKIAFEPCGRSRSTDRAPYCATALLLPVREGFHVSRDDTALHQPMEWPAPLRTRGGSSVQSPHATLLVTKDEAPCSERACAYVFRRERPYHRDLASRMVRGRAGYPVPTRHGDIVRALYLGLPLFDGWRCCLHLAPIPA